VAAIGKLVANHTARDYAKATTWCINDKANLIGLPMWPLHMMHYCDLLGRSPQVRAEKIAGSFIPPVEAPPFKNLPMHDQDHGLYLKEVDDDLAKIANDLPEVENCNDPEETLKTEIERVISTYSEQLYMNARAYGGTHNAWMAGMNGDAHWYVAFSMSRDPQYCPHPIRKGHDQERLLDLRKALWLEDNPVLLG
jgi:hypothetical protein